MLHSRQLDMALNLDHTTKFSIGFLISLVSILSVVIIIKVGSFEEAKRAADAGVDAIIVQGREAGGHIIGQVRELSICSCIKFCNCTNIIFCF